MAAISADDIDRCIVTFCYEVSDRRTVYGTMRTERKLPWAFVQFPDSGDPRYVVPTLAGVGLNAPGAYPYITVIEYMRSSAFPHEQDFGSAEVGTDETYAGPRAIHFYGTGGV